MLIHPALLSIGISTLTPFLNTAKFTKGWRITKILIAEGWKSVWPVALKLLCDLLCTFEKLKSGFKILPHA